MRRSLGAFSARLVCVDDWSFNHVGVVAALREIAARLSYRPDDEITCE